MYSVRNLRLLVPAVVVVCSHACASMPPQPDPAALERAIRHLYATCPDAYPKGPLYLDRLEAIRRTGDKSALAALQREALLANPLLDFEDLLVLRRCEKSPALGLPTNWQGNCALPPGAYGNDVAILSLGASQAPLRSVFAPPTDVCIADIELHYDADRFLFSMPDAHGRWQVYEFTFEGATLRQVTPSDEGDIDNYDPCYLPDERIIFASTATYQGIPCVFGADHVANFFIINPDGTGMRQLCFDQDHNWSPVVLNNGRVLYQRWEYADLPHSNTRLLFHMNPDGTNQTEYYGSNSYWPNSIFYARPIPGHPTMVAGIVTGHHGVRRMGELVLFDPALGRHENTGVVQRIPGYGKKVEALIRDRLVDDSWPRFLHPWPLSEHFFLVASQPTPDCRWGIYLVDTFDNLLLLREEPGHVLFQPIPLRPRERPPVIPDRVDLTRQDALVYLSDLYVGPGMQGVPPGTVESLRIFTYTFSYRGMGGLYGVIGMDGPWDIKRIMGTVPVEPDGSAYFSVPANTPIAVQPLDERGMAVQLMRSWFTAMPGEVVSCVGCHEPQNMAPPSRPTLAMRRPPASITPWHGRERGFSFAREVQPVLDLHCLSCHNGEADSARPSLRGDRMITDYSTQMPGHGPPAISGKFSEAYAELHRFVRRPGIESNYHLLNPMEFHAGTTELVQMLDQGHNGVNLDAESWDRLITWIDLNAPYHGTWTEIMGEENVRKVVQRTRELRLKYAGLHIDYEYIPSEPVVLAAAAAHDVRQPLLAPDPPATLEVTPSKKRPREEDVPTHTIDLGGGHLLEMARIPMDKALMNIGARGARASSDNRTHAEGPFWMSTREITNALYALFDPRHDSGVESKYGYQFGVHGFPVNEPEQPVVRVSFNEAAAFCAWLSERTGLPFRLPTETEWEYACRAGTDTHFHFGCVDSDYSEFANIADETLEQMASNPYFVFAPFENPSRYDAWFPRDTRFSDNSLLTARVGSYLPNPWKLYDMHGNVWEWTATPCSSTPSCAGASPEHGKRVVRGGSWYDRPHRAGAAYRLAYAAWQKVFNVGFRVVYSDREKRACHRADEQGVSP